MGEMGNGIGGTKAGWRRLEDWEREEENS